MGEGSHDLLLISLTRMLHWKKKKVFIFKMLLLWRETQWLLIYSTPSRGDYYCV